MSLPKMALPGLPGAKAQMGISPVRCNVLAQGGGRNSSFSVAFS